MRQVADPETRIQRSFKAKSKRAQAKKERQNMRQLSSLPAGFGSWSAADQNEWLDEHDMGEYTSMQGEEDFELT